MEVQEYNNKNNTLELIKNVLNNCNIEKAIFCGVGVVGLITNNNLIKSCLLAIFIRKLYKIYKNNKYTVDELIDKMV